jgi:hypothetical protein
LNIALIPSPKKLLTPYVASSTCIRNESPRVKGNEPGSHRCVMGEREEWLVEKVEVREMD